ncbi:hypothetical protein E0687_05605 [Thermus tengchongensis]|uniref:Winged helix-turn helix domain-containing protein n=1 Tax=Thermus tengchongensis TaxID=1214928 RepID=A0A4Y9FBJ2_9DEIN|nr:hypothetical protein E0687_05605 [Thermus tengchongensis]
MIPFFVVSFFHAPGSPAPDPEGTGAQVQKGQGPGGKDPLPSRLPRGQGPLRQGDRPHHPADSPLGTCHRAPVQPPGPEALRDGRHSNPGARPKLTPEETLRVLQALEGPPPDGGLWTGPKLQRWVAEHLGKRLSLNPIYRLLHEAGFALRVPRPVHRKAEREAQEAFKKNSAKRWRRPGQRGEG